MTEELFSSYLRNECSGQEVYLLLNRFKEGKHEKLLKSMIRNVLEAPDEHPEEISPETTAVLVRSFDRIRANI